MATSAPPENVDLIMDKFNLLPYFNLIVEVQRKLNFK